MVKDESLKCVMVIDEELPIGLAANAACVLALTLGNSVDGIVGPDVTDKGGNIHRGITTIPIPILRASGDKIREIRLRAAKDSDPQLLVVDFTDAAQSTRTYEDYTERIAQYDKEELRYFGMALHGPKKIVQSLTGSLPLMR